MNDAHMTFGFSEEQRQLRASVLGLLHRVLPASKIRELDEEEKDLLHQFAQEKAA